MNGMVTNNGDKDARLRNFLSPESPVGAAAQNSTAESMLFLQYISEQSHDVAKLKVFHDMAKKILDA